MLYPATPAASFHGNNGYQINPKEKGAGVRGLRVSWGSRTPPPRTMANIQNRHPEQLYYQQAKISDPRSSAHTAKRISHPSMVELPGIPVTH